MAEARRLVITIRRGDSQFIPRNVSRAKDFNALPQSLGGALVAVPGLGWAPAVDAAVPQGNNVASMRMAGLDYRVAFRTAALLGVLILMQWRAAQAAEITVIPDEGTGVPFIAVEGEFFAGDEEKFAEVALRKQKAVVIFNSPGGSALAGVEIGKAIRLKGFSTWVPNGALCASACGFAWLAGVKRFMGPQARIGFHAVYKQEGSGNRETGAGNALVGAYLNTLGLSEGTIVYVTKAGPDSMTWMAYEDAAGAGIDVELIKEDDDNPPPPPPSATNTVPPLPAPPVSGGSGAEPAGQLRAVAMGVKARRQQYEAKTMRDSLGVTKRGLSQNECEASCRMDQRCQGFTYDKWNHLCITRSAAGVLRTDPRSVTVLFSDAAPSFSALAPRMTRYDNSAFPNAPYRSMAGGSFEDCEAACLGETICLGVNYSAASRSCSLFSTPDEYVSRVGTEVGVKTQLADTP